MRKNAVAWAALVLSTAALAGSRISTRPATAVQEIPAEGQRTAKALSEAFEAVADFARPSVVQISVQKKASAGNQKFQLPGGENLSPKEMEEMLKRFFGGDHAPKFEKEQFAAEGTGSGFVYDDKGNILTNNHVVTGADSIKVTFHDGEVADAKIVGTDPEADVAVIKVDNTSYRPLPKGQSDKLKVGEWVVAVGSPFGLDQTVTAGIVSATERAGVGINKYESFVQTDAAINPGNSGGPLIDMNGRVVGINSAIATMTRSSAGVGFTIPIDMASALADKLIKDGKVSRMRVGIRMKTQPLTPSLAKKLGLDSKTHGLVVAEVVPGSPADKAGVKPEDVVVEYDGRAVASFPTFLNLVSASDPGKSYGLKIFRAGKPQTVTITPAPEGNVKFAHELAQEKARGAVASLDGFGLSVQPIDARTAKALGYDSDVKGLVVTGVKPNGSAARAGLEEGDMIVKVVKDKKVTPVTSLEDLVAAAEAGDELTVFVRDVKHPEKDAQVVTLGKKAAEKE